MKPEVKLLVMKACIVTMLILTAGQYLLGQTVYSRTYFSAFVAADRANSNQYNIHTKLFFDGDCFKCLYILRDAGLKGHIQSAGFYNGIANKDSFYTDEISKDANYPNIEPEPDYLLSIPEDEMSAPARVLYLKAISEAVEAGLFKYDLDSLTSQKAELLETLKPHGAFKTWFNMAFGVAAVVFFKSAYYFEPGNADSIRPEQ